MSMVVVAMVTDRTTLMVTMLLVLVTMVVDNLLVTTKLTGHTDMNCTPLGVQVAMDLAIVIEALEVVKVSWLFTNTGVDK